LCIKYEIRKSESTLSIRKSISFSFSAQIINTIIGFVVSVIITRILGTTGRGEQALFTNSLAFAVLFFGFSINSTIPYFINSGKAKAEELLSTIITFVLASTVLIYCTLLLLKYYGKLGIALSEDMQSPKYLLIFTGMYFTNLMTSVISTFLVAYKKFKAVSIYSILSQGLPALIYLLLYLDVLPYDHGNPFRTVVTVMAAVAFFSFVFIFSLFFKILPVRPVKKLLPITLIRQFILFSSMAYVGNVATFFNYKLDFWVVDLYWGKSQLGIYSLAAQLSQLLWILPSTIASVLYSFASTCTEQQAVNYAIQLKQIAFYGILVLAAAGLTLSYFFIPVLYGVEFSGVFRLMTIFVFGVVPFSITTVLASFFAARGNFKVSFVISLVIFAISSTMYFTFIPKFGLAGGAFASALSYLIASVICELWFCRKYNVPVLNLFRPDKVIFSIQGLKHYLGKSKG
jgi:O-antigen/teichoic acid export membrane protein